MISYPILEIEEMSKQVSARKSSSPTTTTRRNPTPVKKTLESNSTSTKTIMLVSAGLLSTIIAWFSLGPSSVVGQNGDQGSSKVDSRGCPIYTDYSMEPHGDRSSGPLGLPFMRPEERCRTFNSSAVEVCSPHSPPGTDVATAWWWDMTLRN